MVSQSWIQRAWRGAAHNVLTYVLGRKTLRVSVDGFDLGLRVPSRDVLGRRLFKRGVHEPHVTRFFERYLEAAPQDVILDVGANVGYFTLIASRRVAPDVTIVAIEADPDNFSLLEQNVELNHAAGVHVRRTAVAADGESAMLYRYKASNTGKHSLIPMEGAAAIEVPVASLDTIWDALELGERRPTLLKIDIEGGEHAAIQHGRRTVSRCPVVVAEFTPKFLERSGTDPSDHIAMMRELAFDPFRIRDDGSLESLGAEVPRDGSAREIAWSSPDAQSAAWFGALTVRS